MRAVAVTAPVCHDGSLTLAGNGDARRRIWRSDIEVMRAKQSVGRWRAGDAAADKVHGRILSLVDYARLPAALRRWWYWRGKLAGY